jgi:hypothetical protein
VAIDHSPKSSGIYLATPALAVLPDGSYVAKSDEHGPGSSVDNGGDALSRVYRSQDRGRSWERIGTAKDLYWANLFVHQDTLYMSGVGRPLGPVMLSRSTDGGETWTEPRDESSGLLREGRFHTSSMPVLFHRGRLWRTMETFASETGNPWFQHRPLMMSVPADDDPMDARNWIFGPPAERDDSGWLNGEWRTWLEGNPVATPEGNPAILLRCDYRRGGEEKAMLVDVSEDGESARFDPETGFADFPGGCKKFNVRFDPASGFYWSLANYVPERHWNHNPERARNTSALLRSKDLRAWEARCAIFYGDDIGLHGFQYADFLFDGDDLIAVYRVAFDDDRGGSANQHDSNWIVFKRIPDFRRLQPDDSVAPWLAEDLKRYNARRIPG